MNREGGRGGGKNRCTKLPNIQNERDRSFFQKPFFQKFVVTPPPEVLGDERTN